MALRVGVRAVSGVGEDTAQEPSAGPESLVSGPQRWAIIGEHQRAAGGLKESVHSAQKRTLEHQGSRHALSVTAPSGHLDSAIEEGSGFLRIWLVLQGDTSQGSGSLWHFVMRTALWDPCDHWGTSGFGDKIQLWISSTSA